jgi:hypothetical protein
MMAQPASAEKEKKQSTMEKYGFASMLTVPERNPKDEDPGGGPKKEPEKAAPTRPPPQESDSAAAEAPKKPRKPKPKTEDWTT